MTAGGRTVATCLGCTLVVSILPGPALGAEKGGAAPAACLDRLYRNTHPARCLAMEVSVRREVPRLQMVYRFARRSPKADLGGVAPADAKTPKLKRQAIPFGVAYASDRPRCTIQVTSLSPGVLIETDASALDLFLGAKTPPQWLAWRAGGKTVVRPAKGRVPLGRLDEPWLLAWWGSRTPVKSAPVEYLKQYNRTFDQPLLILLQRPVQSIEAAADRWRLRFAGSAGVVVLMPLLGLNSPTGEQTHRWAKNLPTEVLVGARAGARRMRSVPVAVSETCELTDSGVRITESFTHRAIKDHWNTPAEPWAMLPPIFGLARAMGGPVELARPAKAQAKDLPWLASFGPLTVLDESRRVSFTIRIPQLAQILARRPVWFSGPRASKKHQVLLAQLRAEIDKVLAVNEHMAPFCNLGAGIKGNWHWGNPAETIITLSWALPFLEPAKADALKAYLRKEFEACDPLEISHAPLGAGARRELYHWDPAGKWAKLRFAKNPWRTPNLLNLYAVSQYVDSAGGRAAAKRLWPRVRQYLARFLEAGGTVWDGGESAFAQDGLRFGAQANLNAHVSGYLGYTRLARLAGDKQAERLGTCLLARGLAVLYAAAYYHQYLIDRGLREGLVNFPPRFFCDTEKFQANRLASFSAGGLYFGNGFREMEMPYHFLVDLTPEIGEFLHAYCRRPVAVTVKWMMWKNPGCWLNRGLRPFPSAQGEHWIIEPWVPWTNFLGLAEVVRPPADELYHYVGDSRARFGDLYYIQRLALALRAYERQH